ncbi:MAG: DUF4129 domain-containing protein [Anaerolineae bacterium]|nr:DUF4129 domain-containing protein [Anaerolineae bacterium]
MMGNQGIRPPETLNYKDEDTVDLPPFVLDTPWVWNGLLPLAIGVMVACVASALVQCIRLWAPDWNGTYLLVAPILAALAGHTTYRLGKRKYISGMDHLHQRALEVGVMFILLKIATHMGDTVGEMIAYFRAWQSDPFSFFDGQTLVAFGLSFAAWYAAGATARNLEEIADPYLRLERGGVPPADLITRRFFIGGGVLLLFSGLARVGIEALLSLDRPRVPGLILNVLVYFVLGLVLLSQVHFARLTRLWQSQHITIAPGLAGGWARYSLVFLTVILVIAFLLPTGYTVSLLDIGAYLISLIVDLVLLLWFLVTLPFVWLLSLFTQQDGTAQMPALTQLEFSSPPPETVATGYVWWQWVRSALFWGVLLVGGYLLVRGYVRDRSGLWQSLRRFRFARILCAFWESLVQLWRGMGRTIQTQLPRVSRGVLTWFRRRSTFDGDGMLRRRGRSARERVFYFYLSLLDRARERGIPRAKTQTPHEYQTRLAPQLEAVQAENVVALTEMFVEARYSAHPVTDEMVQRAQAEWEQLQAAIAQLETAETRETEEQGVLGAEENG